MTSFAKNMDVQNAFLEAAGQNPLTRQPRGANFSPLPRPIKVATVPQLRKYIAEVVRMYGEFCTFLCTLFYILLEPANYIKYISLTKIMKEKI